MHQRLLRSIGHANDLSMDRVEYVSRELTGCDRSWDMLVADVVDPMGCLHQQVLHDIAIARYVLFHIILLP